MKNGIMDMFQDFYYTNSLVWRLNSTFIALITQKKDVSRINYYGHISLLNSTYNLIAKVLANRLKGVLGVIIEPTQGAFIKGRQIMGGILIANENKVSQAFYSKFILRKDMTMLTGNLCFEQMGFSQK